MHIPGIHPDTDNDGSSWNGDESDTDGRTPVVNPDGGNDASWSGGEDIVEGNKKT